MEKRYKETDADSDLKRLGISDRKRVYIMERCFGACSSQKGMPEILKNAITQYEEDKDFAGGAGNWVFSPERAHEHIYRNIEQQQIESMNPLGPPSTFFYHPTKKF